MILAAGLGTRLRPLTLYRAKPALPVRGRAVISILLDFLSRHGIDDVMINLHYLPESIRVAVENDCPAKTRITWSVEPEPLGTGGGIRKAAPFLKRDDQCVVLAGDMILDLDLTKRMQAHVESGNDATLLLRDDPRHADFGTIGLDGGGRVSRVGHDHFGGAAAEASSGIFTGVRFFSRSVFQAWPESPGVENPAVFEDLRDWLMPAAAAGRLQVGGDCIDRADCVWEPVGTPAEYLKANLAPPSLPSLGGRPSRWEGAIDLEGPRRDVVLGDASVLGEGAKLSRAVVWEGEMVPPGFEGAQGVFAHGEFHPVEPSSESGPAESVTAKGSETSLQETSGSAH